MKRSIPILESEFRLKMTLKVVQDQRPMFNAVNIQVQLSQKRHLENLLT